MHEAEYKRLYHSEERLWWFRALRLFLQKYLSRLNNHKTRKLALDIGCGTGAYMTHLAKAGYEVFGLDYSNTAIRFTEQRGHKNLVIARANDIPYRETFDLITCIDVLEVETVDHEKLIESALNSLKPGGHGLFIAAAHQWLLSEHDRAVGSVRRFSLRQLESLFLRKGVRILHSSYLFVFVFPLMVIRKLLNPSRNSHPENRAVSDVSVPSALINLPLYFLCMVEALMYPTIKMPIGSSVFVMVQKDE